MGRPTATDEYKDAYQNSYVQDNEYPDDFNEYGFEFLHR